MIKITEQLNAGKYTVLCLDAPVPLQRFDKVGIDGNLYEAEIVYDLPRSIGIMATGNFVGKKIEFL